MQRVKLRTYCLSLSELLKVIKRLQEAFTVDKKIKS